MFCTMFTASPPATGSAALAVINAVSEQPGRAARRKWHGDGPSPCHFRLAQLAAATLAVFTSASAPEASRGHAFPVGWKRGTLDPPYLNVAQCNARTHNTHADQPTRSSTLR